MLKTWLSNLHFWLIHKVVGKKKAVIMNAHFPEGLVVGNRSPRLILIANCFFEDKFSCNYDPQELADAFDRIIRHRTS